MLWNQKVERFNPDDAGKDVSLHNVKEERTSMLYSTLQPNGCRRNTLKMVPDQSFHLDAETSGVLTWMNCTAFNHETAQENQSYLGVYLNSARCISAIKKLGSECYEDLKNAISAWTLPDESSLLKRIEWGSFSEKLSIVWSDFVQCQLRKQKIDQTWKRAYLEIDEFEGIIASLSTVHFGARFPMVFEGGPVGTHSAGISHLRMHSYIGREVATSDQAVEGTTINLRSHPTLQAALQYISPIDHWIPTAT